MTQHEFESLALEEFDALYRMAYHLTHRTDQAADLVQETYLRALKAAGRFELRAVGIRPWLYTILRNLFYSSIQKQRRDRQLNERLRGEFDERAISDDVMTRPLDWDLLDEQIKHAVEDLDARQREVLLLWAVDGFKYREIAEILHVPIGTVMSRLHRARAVLTQELAETDELESGLHAAVHLN